MTLYQFRLLDEMEQIEAVWDAVHLLDWHDGAYEYKLYQRDGFYIELKRHIEHNVMLDMRAFKSTTPFDASFTSTSGSEDSASKNVLASLLDACEIKRKAARRGKILVWYILMPLALLFLAFRIWQFLTGRL